jgi:hypothetical protein
MIGLGMIEFYNFSKEKRTFHRPLNALFNGHGYWARELSQEREKGKLLLTVRQLLPTFKHKFNQGLDVSL